MPRSVKLLNATLLFGLVVALTACGATSTSGDLVGSVSSSTGSADKSTESSTTENVVRQGPDNLVEFAAKSVDAGGVEVVIQPDLISEAGAAFTVSLDTHSVELSMDPAAGARLEIGGIEWPVVNWDGDPVGGHHRSGILTFSAAGPVEGEITIEFDGFPGLVTATWQLGD
ncbi:MAG TPA: hypothetical protein VJ482_12690 [Acidimicrobiia bacterium]|nr:hypothetical protein [Acidimicrobiia bacterium]